MSYFQLEPLIFFYGILILSFLIGMPMAHFLVQPYSRLDNNKYLFIYASVVLGYCLLHLVVYISTQIVHTGTDAVVYPVIGLFLSITAAYIYILNRKNIIVPIPSLQPLVYLILLIAISTAHVLLPVIAGMWEMAYATGDDASRWYMVVNYFQSHPFEYTKTTEETLRWGMRERPLQNISGAIIASIFGLKASIAYSLSSASAMAIAALAFFQLYESMFVINSNRDRYILWIVAAIFFGLFGSFINVYYTGRTTHHFSVFAVLAPLAFVAISESGMRRFIWYCFWAVMLAYIYSIRFTLNFSIMAGAIILAQYLVKEIQFKVLIRNYFSLVASFFIACLAAYQETKAIVVSLKTSGLFFLMLQRDSSYGADGTIWDRIFKWSGFLGTYERHDYFPPWVRVILFTLLLFVVVIAIIQALKQIRKKPAYAGLLIFTLITATSLFITENYYVAWKSSLYWPAFILLGYMAFSISSLSSSKLVVKIIGVCLVIVPVGYIGITSRQYIEFLKMIKERHTKVDMVTNRLESKIEDYLRGCSTCGKNIFGYDLSPERHLLIREILRNYDWQPVRSKELNFENDIAKKDPVRYDKYEYDILLYAKTYKCEAFDFSGNARSMLYDIDPFKVYSKDSSFVEFRHGIEMRMFGEYDPEQKCRIYGGEVVDSDGVLMVINNGSHAWYEFKVRLYQEQKKSDINNFNIHTELKSHFTLTEKSETDKYKEYVARLDNVESERMIKVVLEKLQPDIRLVVTSVKWGD